MDKSILETIHEGVEGLHKAKLVDNTTLREFDALCLPKITAYTSTQIKSIRLKAKASQSVFAAYLNTSVSTIQKWEQGIKKPNGISLKLLHLVEDKGLEILV